MSLLCEILDISIICWSVSEGSRVVMKYLQSRLPATWESATKVFMVKAGRCAGKGVNVSVVAPKVEFVDKLELETGMFGACIDRACKGEE